MAAEHSISLFQTITLGIAVVGAVLGIINTWHGLDAGRIKLRVKAGHLISVGLTALPSNVTFYVEVTNLSSFPVTISDVGVFYHGTKYRGSMVTGFPSDGKFPKRLEARSSFSVYSQRPQPLKGHRLKCAYATTQCGYTKTGTGPALKQIASEMYAAGK